MIADCIDRLFGCGASHFGLRAGAEAFGHPNAHLDDALGLGLRERLCVSIGDDEIDALQPSRDHVIDGIAAGAADAEHGNARLHLANVGDVGHGCFRLLEQAGTRGHGLLPTSLAVCFHYGRGEMSQSACGLSLAAEPADPQSGQLAFKPRRRFLGRHGLGSRLEQLDHQAIGSLALALKICPVARRPCFEPRDLRLQCLDLCLSRAMLPAWRYLVAAAMPYLSEINAHHGFAVMRQ